MSFNELGLDEKLSNNLLTHGISAPTLIQKEVFAPIKEGRSVVALSKTGTGKTLAYLAPLVQRHLFEPSKKNLDLDSSAKHGAHSLVLVPTRELADQVSRNLELLGSPAKSVVIVGGESEKKQIESGLDAELIVATPGRLLDLLQRKLLRVDSVESVIFDEADRILDMGFIDDVRSIRTLLPQKLQMCFFSATLHFGVDEMAYEFGVEAERFGQEEERATVDGLDHRVAFVGDDEKFHALVSFVARNSGQRGIVFCNYRDRAHHLVSRLGGLGIRCDALTAQLHQSARSRCMDDFRLGRIEVLFASDLAARGLDVEDVDFVINFDLPDDSSTYVHRVGRTARAGKNGIALSLVGFEDSYRLEKLERFLGAPIVRYQFESHELGGPLALKRNRSSHQSDRQVSPEQSTGGAESRPHHKNRGQRQQRGPEGAAAQKSNSNLSSRPRDSQNHLATAGKRQAAERSTTTIAQSPKASSSMWSRMSRFVLKLLGLRSAPVAASSAADNKNGRTQRDGSGRYRDQRRGQKGRNSKRRGGGHSVGSSGYSGRRQGGGSRNRNKQR